MESDQIPPSPGLNMDHGFLRRIEKNQHSREKQAKQEQLHKNRDAIKFQKKVGFVGHSNKPAMKIYRPPNLRGSGDFTGNDSDMDRYMMANFNAQPPPPLLSKSKSTTSANRVRFQLDDRGSSLTTASTSRLQPADDSSLPQATSIIPEAYVLKRSKSLGPGQMKTFASDLDLTGFSADVQSAIQRAIQDPNQMTARQLMEIVRHLFNRVLESVRYAEPTARLCISIIQKEKNETFLESLLNSCRKWYNERDRLSNLVPTATNPQPPVKSNRWVAYVTFLYELYTRLKSRKQNPMVASNTAPSILVLTLLTECCLLFLRPSSLMGHSEIECLFIVLTSVGRDLAIECPQRMQTLMSAVREAFLVPSIPHSVHKTLLQLIELNASHWQMVAPAMTYYYPGNQRE